MRFVVQRVTHASVTVDGNVIGKIGQGFMVLIGVSDEDTKETADKMVGSIAILQLLWLNLPSSRWITEWFSSTVKARFTSSIFGLAGKTG